MKKSMLPPEQRSMNAEAAAWLARLHSDQRTLEDEAAFRLWLVKDERHGDAFARVTMAWDIAGSADADREIPPSADRGHSRRAFVLASVVGAIAVAGAGYGTWIHDEPDVYTTAIGEQRRVTLADGSSILLDTNSSLKVRLGQQRREIDLVKGRAHFVVAHDPLRPFTVRAGGQQVVALGTAFDVDHYDDKVEVLLTEGRVAVMPARPVPVRTERILHSGDRLLFQKGVLVRQDRPEMDNMSAWQSGRLIFSQDTFADVAKAFNRYSQRQLVIADPSLAQMQISGAYDAGSPEAFARSAALLLPIRVEVSGQKVILTLNLDASGKSP